MNPLLGSIIMFAGNFAPRGWAFCNGQLLSISQHAALFSLLGTSYGGDDGNNFALPDLRGRVPIHAGEGPGLSEIVLGEEGGAETVMLTAQQLPAHTHTTGIRLGGSVGNTEVGTDNYLAFNTVGETIFTSSTPAGGVQLNANSVSVGNTGGNQAVPVRDPYLGLNYIIALVGVYPS